MNGWVSRILSLGAALGICFLIQFFFGELNADYLSRMVFLAGIYVTLAVSLNIINGICGQFSIGHAAFYQIGAYFAGYLATTMYAQDGKTSLTTILIVMVTGAIASGIVGFVVGLPSLKLKGDYLAIVTLGFGEIIRIITINVKEIGGSYGITGIATFKPLWLVWFLAVVCIAVSRNLIKSAHGLTFLAVREDEVAASAMGVNVTRTKVTAFVLGSMFAGAAGVLFAHHEGFITPDHFKMEVSFIILTMVVLGGTGSITGSTLAAVALFGIPEYLRGLKDSSGLPLTVDGAGLVASFIAVILVVAAVKRIETRYHVAVLKKAGAYATAIVAGVLLQWLMSKGLGGIESLSSNQYEVSKLRMIIFAGTLIIVMLLRPQGVLADHELSWSWIKTLFSRKPKQVKA